MDTYMRIFGIDLNTKDAGDVSFVENPDKWWD